MDPRNGFFFNTLLDSCLLDEPKREDFEEVVRPTSGRARAGPLCDMTRTVSGEVGKTNER